MNERGEKTDGAGAKVDRPAAAGFFGSLKDALLAASRDDMPSSPARLHATPAPLQQAQAGASPNAASAPPPALAEKPAGAAAEKAAPAVATDASSPPPLSPSAEEVARLARAATVKPERIPAPNIERETIPTTRVLRAEGKKPAVQESDEAEEAPRTQLVRGRKPIERGTFTQDPVVGFLIVVGGAGLGAFRPIFEGNNTLGRSKNNRIPLDFGDETISSEAQAYIRYDSGDRSFLFVPNLAKTNVVSVNEQRPTGALELKSMDVITLGRTQVAFVPFCGAEFDWSEIAEA